MQLLKDYTDSRIALSDAVPDSAKFRRTSAEGQAFQRRLWAFAGEVLNMSPQSSAPRLYVETLNEMIDAQSTRLAALENRVPDAVLYLQLAMSALAFGVLGLYLALLGRGVLLPLVGAVLVAVMLLVIFDLDRPHRGFINVPSTPLVNERASMVPPPAAVGPTVPPP